MADATGTGAPGSGTTMPDAGATVTRHTEEKATATGKQEVADDAGGDPRDARTDSTTEDAQPGSQPREYTETRSGGEPGDLDDDRKAAFEAVMDTVAALEARRWGWRQRLSLRDNAAREQSDTPTSCSRSRLTLISPGTCADLRAQPAEQGTALMTQGRELSSEAQVARRRIPDLDSVES
ncbi:hypothetical protein EVJ58_g8778 [Rhodofomes roseus]|uniref:Uncharacterized protein n=1 Tax=Rhodofomes roseus TaxID=34475 RepID=A0A4Y9XY46_9APHY|nr:hypothetical protein EVJ58_g8778 [Rhodofomes roseus]